MLNLGFGEIAIIVVLAIVVVGPDRLPEMLRFLGKQYGKVMRASNELRRAFMIEADRDEAKKRAETLRKRREQARKRAEEARKRAMERAKQLEGADEGLPRDLLTPDLDHLHAHDHEPALEPEAAPAPTPEPERTAAPSDRPPGEPPS